MPNNASLPTALRLPRKRLRAVERLAVPVGDTINQWSWLKAATRPLWRYLGKNFVTILSKNLYEVHGAEHLRSVDAPGGIVLVANHRSFFDLFFTGATMIDTRASLIQRMIFPVRKDFFYDHPVGFFINVALTSASMWPPIFRDERRREFNPIAMAQIGRSMRKGTLCGIHPEGTRGNGPDPYALGKAKPGVGQLLLSASPDVMVQPAWILGMSNDFVGTAWRNFRPAGQRGEPVRICFGPAIRAGDLVERCGKDPQAIAEAIMEHVAALGELDRAHRAANPRSA